MINGFDENKDFEETNQEVNKPDDSSPIDVNEFSPVENETKQQDTVQDETLKNENLNNEVPRDVNHIPYNQNASVNTQMNNNANNGPYTNPFLNNNQQQNETYTYTPYVQHQDVFNDNKFTPIDYNNGATKKNNGLLTFLIVLVVVFAFCAAVFAGMYFYKGNLDGSNPINQEQKVNSGPNLTINSKPADAETETANTNGKLTVSEIAKRVRPSVVGIVTYSAQTDLQNFGQASGSGSGVIMCSDGYIITNAHVISGASRIEVVLDNGDSLEGKIVGSDTKTDLAVIKINKKNLTVAEFGDSSQTQVGEDVVAIGNPAGLELAGSLTKGIVSAVERAIQSSTSGYTMKCIQTDAAINPGNSGGALVNMYGQVIGINSSKISSVDYEGIGFAIASNDAKPIVDDLIRYNYVKGRAKIGITYQEITSIYAQYQGIPAGLFIASVDEKLDIYAKGVRAGDIITKVDGKDITGAEVLTELLKNKKAGDKLKLTIYRHSQTGKSTTFSVTITLAEDRGNSTTSSTIND